MTERVDGDGPGPDIRLVESSDGWQLTITPDAFADLRAANDKPAGSRTEFFVQVHPNLVPGDPFPAQLKITELAPERT